MAQALFRRQSAANYALTWTFRTNPDFPNLVATGLDCTNFVSQALYAAGWPMVSYGPTDDRSWFYVQRAFMNISRSWAGAQPFERFLAASRRAEKCDADQLGIGDVVQIKYMNESTARLHTSHTAIVTDMAIVGTTKVPFLSYHSHAKMNVPLTDLLQRIPQDRFIFWKLKDVFDYQETEDI